LESSGFTLSGSVRHGQVPSGTIGTVTPPPELDPPRGSDLPSSEPLRTWDVFLSHGGPDKPWVQTLADELAALGLQPFLDVREIEPADSFPGVLSRGLAGSRFLVLILSPRSSRPWVDLEWQSFIAHHGPLGRVLPVLLESTEIPALLASIQRIDATDRDAPRVAREIAHIAGRPGQLKEGDVRRLVLGQDLVFNLSREGEDLCLIDPLGRKDPQIVRVATDQLENGSWTRWPSSTRFRTAKQLSVRT
jgi:hypothetical protein